MTRNTIPALALGLACVMALATAAPAPGCNIVGATCASRPPQYQQDCRNNWVNTKIQAAGNGLIGADCASRGPANYQQCINDWVNKQMAANSKGMLGGSCATVTPSSQQDCINAWIDEQMQAEACAKPAPAPKCTVGTGAVCAKGDTSCFNKFANLVLTPAGAVGGCAGVAPQYTNACVETNVIGAQSSAVKSLYSSGSRAPPGATCGSIGPQYRRSCVETFLSDMMRAGKGKCLDGQGQVLARAVMQNRLQRSGAGSSSGLGSTAGNGLVGGK